MRLDSNAVLADDPLPTSVTHTSEFTPVYEDILPPETKKKIELQENVAYGPVYLLHLSAILSVRVPIIPRHLVFYNGNNLAVCT